MEARWLTVGPVQENTWIARLEGAEQALLIDPGDEPDTLTTALDELGASVEAILITHCHFDHVGDDCSDLIELAGIVGSAVVGSHELSVFLGARGIEATGMNTITRTVGGALGGQIAASIVAGHLMAQGLPEESGYTTAFLMSAIAVSIAVLAAMLIPGRVARDTEAATA